MIQHKSMIPDKNIKTNIIMNPSVSLFSTYIMSRYGFNSAAFRPVDLYFLELLGLEFDPEVLPKQGDQTSTNTTSNYINNYHNHIVQINKSVNIIHQLRMQSDSQYAEFSNAYLDKGAGKTKAPSANEVGHENQNSSPKNPIVRFRQTVQNMLDRKSSGSDDRVDKVNPDINSKNNQVVKALVGPLQVLVASTQAGRIGLDKSLDQGQERPASLKAMEMILKSHETLVPLYESSNRTGEKSHSLKLPLYHLNGLTDQVLSQMTSLMPTTSTLNALQSTLNTTNNDLGGKARERHHWKDTKTGGSFLHNLNSPGFKEWMRAAQSYLMHAPELARTSKDVYIPALASDSLFINHINHVNHVDKFESYQTVVRSNEGLTSKHLLGNQNVNHQASHDLFGKSGASSQVWQHTLQTPERFFKNIEKEVSLERKGNIRLHFLLSHMQNHTQRNDHTNTEETSYETLGYESLGHRDLSNRDTQGVSQAPLRRLGHNVFENVFQSHFITSLLQQIGLEVHVFNNHAMALLLSKSTMNFRENAFHVSGAQTVHLRHQSTYNAGPVGNKTQQVIEKTDLATLFMLNHQLDRHLLENGQFAKAISRRDTWLKFSEEESPSSHSTAASFSKNMESVLRGQPEPVLSHYSNNGLKTRIYQDLYRDLITKLTQSINHKLRYERNQNLYDLNHNLSQKLAQNLSQNQYYGQNKDHYTSIIKTVENVMNLSFVHKPSAALLKTSLIGQPSMDLMSHMETEYRAYLKDNIRSINMFHSNTITSNEINKNVTSNNVIRDNAINNYAISSSISPSVLGPFNKNLKNFYAQGTGQSNKQVGPDSYETHMPLVMNQTHVQMIHQTVYKALSQLNQSLQHKVPMIIDKLSHVEVEEAFQSQAVENTRAKKKKRKGKKAKHQKKRKTQKSLIDRVLLEERKTIEELLSKQFQTLVLDQLHEGITSHLENALSQADRSLDLPLEAHIPDGLEAQINETLNNEIIQAFESIIGHKAITKINKDHLYKSFENLTKTYVTGLITQETFEGIYKDVETVVSRSIESEPFQTLEKKHDDKLLSQALILESQFTQDHYSEVNLIKTHLRILKDPLGDMVQKRDETLSQPNLLLNHLRLVSSQNKNMGMRPLSPLSKEPDHDIRPKAFSVKNTENKHKPFIQDQTKFHQTSFNQSSFHQVDDQDNDRHRHTGQAFDPSQSFMSTFVASSTPVNMKLDHLFNNSFNNKIFNDALNMTLNNALIGGLKAPLGPSYSRGLSATLNHLLNKTFIAQTHKTPKKDLNHSGESAPKRDVTQTSSIHQDRSPVGQQAWPNSDYYTPEALMTAQSFIENNTSFRSELSVKTISEFKDMTLLKGPILNKGNSQSSMLSVTAIRRQPFNKISDKIYKSTDFFKTYTSLALLSNTRVETYTKLKDFIIGQNYAYGLKTMTGTSSQFIPVLKQMQIPLMKSEPPKEALQVRFDKTTMVKHSNKFIHVKEDLALDKTDNIFGLKDNLIRTARKVSQDLMGQTQTLMHQKITDQFVQSKKHFVNHSLLRNTHLQTRESMTNLDVHDIQEVEHHTIRPVKMDYAKQAVHQMPKMDEKPASRPMQTIEIDQEKAGPSVDDLMTYKTPIAERQAMENVDVDAIFERIYSKFEKRIAFEKRRRGL